ncbi:nucleolar transcription factor 1 [Tribolium castaneum]|uniref:Nucleolar transcription factor 1-like Protein n=1 Tax=Tribolium castaneum TaxID=7070 RepID=D6WS16_TRICA|nr:PREDICTED: nucleolar transcription factor 1 [Tribolium castaneum]EFA06402.1 Nucleolar transcription factor 1-like Protein [Tribolium castaneum]|eukprot:XP_969922.1 PREDICTED: nucleolar transcription factor 1 [Tribolium castaneum]
MPKRKSSSSDDENRKKHKFTKSVLTDTTNITKNNNPNEEQITWPQDAVLQLISNIEENIPSDDNLSFHTRLEKLNWENIAFGDYSPKECQDKWASLCKQVRKYRLLGEIATDIRQWVTNPKVRPGAKHPDKPKQPKNSYMFFFEAKRSEVMAQNPDLHPVEVSRKLGELFKNLTMKEKEKYEQLAKIARQEYLEKLQVFYEAHPDLVPKKTPRRGKSYEGPEKPKTPFELFVKVESEKEESEVSRYVVIQKCRERWNEFSDKEKFFWINWAEEEYAKYLEDLKEYIKEHPDYEPGKLKPLLNKNEQKIKQRASGKPQRPPKGPYQLFLKMMMETDEIRKINSRDCVNYISDKWRACSEEEKAEYRTRVEQMWLEYDSKLEEYIATLPPEKRDQVREEESRNKKIKSPTVAPKIEDQPKERLEKPTMPPSNEYKFFLSVYKGKEKPETIWKAMTKKEKEVFATKLNELRRKYIADYELYLKSLSREELEKLGESLAASCDSSSESESDMEAED